MQAFLARLPDWNAVTDVYASIVGLVYSWSVLASLYTLPSWLFFLEPREIGRIYAWMLLTNFIESLLLLAFAIALDVVWPRRTSVKSGFRARSLAAVLVVCGSAVVRLAVLDSYSEVESFTRGEGVWWLATALIAMVLAWASSRISAAASVLDGVSERARIFLPIYLPLTLVGLGVLAWHTMP